MSIIRANASRYQVRAPRWLRLVAPIVVPVFVFSASFGVVAQEAQMGVIGALVMSATTFAGTAQLAAASLLATDADAMAAVAAAVVLNGRYVAMGIAAAACFRGPIWQRLAEAQLIVDESWALAQNEKGEFDRTLLLGTGAALLAVWMTGTLVGSVVGGRFGELTALGIDAVVPALFLGLLLPRLTTRRARRIAVVSALLALAATPVAPPGVPILAGLGGLFAGGDE